MATPIEIRVDEDIRTGPKIAPWWIKNWCANYGEIQSYNKTGDIATVIFKDQKRADLAMAILQDGTALESGTRIRGWWKGGGRRSGGGGGGGGGSNRGKGGGNRGGASDSHRRGRRDDSRSRGGGRDDSRDRGRARDSRSRPAEKERSRSRHDGAERAGEASVAPEIENFKKKFNISAGSATHLQEALAKAAPPQRQSYFIELEQVFEKSALSGKDPNAELPGILTKIKEGEPLLLPWDDGEGEGAEATDASLPDIERIQTKYGLSIGARLSLEEALEKHDDKTKQSYFFELDEVLGVEVSKGKDPSATVPDLISRMNEHEPLLQPWLDDSDDEKPPPPPPPLLC